MVFLAFCCFKIMEYRNNDKFIAEPSLECIKNIGLSALTNKNTNIRDSELNEVISWWLCNTNNKGNIKNTAVYFVGENQIEIYGSFIYLGRELTFWTNGEISVDEEYIKFKPDKIEVGSLKIPTELVFYMIGKELPDCIKCIDNYILFPKEYSFNVLDKDYTIKITDVSCEKGVCTLFF